MRLLVVTHNYPRFPGDAAGAFVARLAAGAARRGAEVRVVAPHTPGTPREERGGGLLLRRFRYAPAPLETVAYGRGPGLALLLPLFVVAFARAVRRAVREFAPHVVHAHWWLPAGWLVRARGVPYVVTCHGSDVRLLDRGPWWRWLARPVFRGAGAVTAVSRFLADDVRRLGAVPAERVAALPMPVDVAHFERGRAVPKAEPPRLLYAGNLVPSKGVDLLIEALAQLRARGVPCRVKVLGQGSAEAELRALAARLGVARDVEWSPFVPQDAMPAEYGASTVTVLPTRGRAEGLGLALVEALLAGSAVVGSPAGGIPEVVEHERTGLLFRDGDPADLAAQLERLLTDAALRRRLSDAGYGRVRERHDPDASSARFWELYRDVAGRRAHA